MYRNRLIIPGSLFFILTMLIGCGDVDPVNKPLPPETEEIRIVLKDRWKQGYETEDLELYMSSFWEEG